MDVIWKDLVGQENVKNLLNFVIKSGKIPHSLLFKGDNGIGKDFAAIKFAQAVYKELVPGSEAIQKAIANFEEPYIKYIFPLPRGKGENEDSGPYDKLSTDEIDQIREELQAKRENPYYKMKIARANDIKINSIREVKRFIALQHFEAPYKFIIISDAHLMNEFTQNALLKSLEEPPENTFFILTTPYASLLRETIISRCRQIDFTPLSNNNVMYLLNKYYNVDVAKAEKIASFSEGSITNAVHIIENDLQDLIEKTINILRNSLGGQCHTAFTELSALIKDNSEMLSIIVHFMVIWFVDNEKYRAGYSDLIYIDYVDTIKKFNVKYSWVNLAPIVERLDYLYSKLKNNINSNIFINNLVLELANLTIK